MRKTLPHRQFAVGETPKKSVSYLVLPFFVLASLVLTWPLARDFDSHLPAVFTSYDALMHVFLLGWGWQGLTTAPLDVFDAPIFHPEVRTLTYMDHLLGQAVLAGPIIELFGLGAAYNSLILFSFVASAYFVYRLARLYGISRAGSCVAGFLFAFCPYRFSHLGCLNQIQTQFIPLGLFFAVRFLRTGRTDLGVGVVLTLAVQSYFGWYGTFHLLVALLVLAGWEAVRVQGAWRNLPWMKAVPLGFLGAALMAPGALPYLLQKAAMPEYGHAFSETMRLSARFDDYLRVNPGNILARVIPPLGGRWPGFFPGLVATGLAAVAIVVTLRAQAKPAADAAGRGRRTLAEATRAAILAWGPIGYFPVLLVSGLVLSLGPFLQVAGHRLWIPLPYLACYYLIPGFSSMRTPGRFAVLVALAMAVLAGLGLDAMHRGRRRFRFVLPAGTLLVAGILAWSPGIPFVRYPDRPSMPAVYEWLAAQPDALPVLELPVPARGSWESPEDVRRQVYVLYHGKPRLDGASGFTSNLYTEFRRDMQEFPSPAAVERAYDMGARRVIVHYGDFPPPGNSTVRLRIEAAPRLHEVAAFGGDVVYEIVQPDAR